MKTTINIDKLKQMEESLIPAKWDFNTNQYWYWNNDFKSYIEIYWNNTFECWTIKI